MKITETWAVEVTYDEEDPGVYGPYTEDHAGKIARTIQREADLCHDENGDNYHPCGIRGAQPFRLSRYDQFLTGEQRHQVGLEKRATREHGES